MTDQEAAETVQRMLTDRDTAIRVANARIAEQEQQIVALRTRADAAERLVSDISQRAYGLERALEAASKHRLHAMMQRARWQTRYETRRAALLAQLRRLRAAKETR